MSRLIVKNLPSLITKEKLYEIFSEKGVVTDVQLKYTKNGVFRKFAFIGFQKAEYAEAAKVALDKSFINMSRIQVETCAELGDPQKPRAWSRHAPENLIEKKKKKQKEKRKNAKVDKDDDDNDDEGTVKKKKKKTTVNEKIKDPTVKELLKIHEKDELFSEFMKVNIPDLSLTSSTDKKESDDGDDEYVESHTKCEKEEISRDHDEDDESGSESHQNAPANQQISDSEYIKLKTGQEVNLASEKKEVKEEEGLKKNGKKISNIELFTVKITGLDTGVKKSLIKQFLKPLKPFTIRRALRCRGTAYCGFKTEKEMKQALTKNRSFLNGKRLYVMEEKKKTDVHYDEEKELKWKREAERLGGLETVAESGRIFARNLPYTSTEEDLQKLFEAYGPISEMIFPIDSFTRKPKGFAIVTFLIPEHACKAFNELDGTVFCGRMLHLIPSLPKKEKIEDESEGLTFKEGKLKKEKTKANSTATWNTFFVGENALAEVVAATYKTTKETVLDDRQNGAAVRLALGETQLVSQMKNFLRENDVSLEAFENMAASPRSRTVILAKNLPFGSTVDQLREKFAKFGLIKRIVLPPSGVAALVEFVEASEARTAFKRLAYARFKNVPLFLEWAPEKVFTKEVDAKSEQSIKEKKEETSESTISNCERLTDIKPEEQTESEQRQVFVPEEGSVIFVKNLNFSTEEDSLRRHFESCGPVASVTIARKKDPKNPGMTLSMGYGFVNFTRKESADEALKKLQFTNLDNHRIELKRSNRTVAPEAPTYRKTTKSHEKPSSKILVRNVPFQATKKEVEGLFKVFGEIKAIRLPKKMVGTGSHRGFCFVEYNTVQDAKRAFAALSDSTHLYGRRLVLEWAATEEDVEALREKTAHQFIAGSRGDSQRKKISIDDIQNDE